jgi:Regulated-SNARE-like domain
MLAFDTTVNSTRFSYLISDNVVYLVIADKSYPRKLAFSYLDELSKEFLMSYGQKVESVRKPYAFVGFGEKTLIKLLIPTFG